MVKIIQTIRNLKPISRKKKYSKPNAKRFKRIRRIDHKRFITFMSGSSEYGGRIDLDRTKFTVKFTKKSGMSRFLQKKTYQYVSMLSKLFDVFMEKIGYAKGSYVVSPIGCGLSRIMGPSNKYTYQIDIVKRPTSLDVKIIPNESRYKFMHVLKSKGVGMDIKDIDQLHDEAKKHLDLLNQSVRVAQVLGLSLDSRAWKIYCDMVDISTIWNVKIEKDVLNVLKDCFS